MFQVETLKQQVYKQLQDSGMFKNMQAQLKKQILTILESQPSSKQSALKFTYEHPLLPKLEKYNLTHICLDLIQEFLQAFKFEHTLSVFKKQVNRENKINRDQLAKSINIESNQSVLITAVEILKNGQVSRKKESAYLGAPENLKKEFKPEITTKPSEKEFSKTTNDFNQKQTNTKQKLQKDIVNQEQKHQEIKKQKSVSPSPSPPPNVKPKKQQPKTAADFLGSIMSKHVPKQQPKKPIYERAQSAPASIKTPPPPQTGTNKIRGGVTSGKPSPISALLKGTSSVSKDPYSYDLKSKTPSAYVYNRKSQQQIDQEIDEFQQSRDSTRKNPLFSSTQQALQSMGYDQSVDSLAIEQCDHYEIAKKKKR